MLRAALTANSPGHNSGGCRRHSVVVLRVRTVHDRVGGPIPRSLRLGVYEPRVLWEQTNKATR